MKKIRTLLSAVGVILLVGSFSCKKGDTGAVGPVGPVGPKGPDSVTYSPWIKLAFVDNTVHGQYEDTIIALSITKKILDSGVVLSYVNFEDSLGIYHVYPLSSPIFYDNVYEDFSVGKINIGARYDFSGLPYRYVTIPGAMVTGNSTEKKIKGYTPAELKAMPFSQLQAVLADKN